MPELTLEQAKNMRELARSGLRATARRYARAVELSGEAPVEAAELEARAIDLASYHFAYERARLRAEPA